MKTLLAISLCFSFSAFADFSEDHTKLCSTPEVKKLMGKTGSCRIMVGQNDISEVSGHCEGKLSDITCRVMVLKTSDSASMNLLCGEETSPLLTQVLDAEVYSYNVAAIVETADGNFVTINDPKDYFLLSSNALDVQLAKGEDLQGKMILTLQDRSITLSNVTCN